ncbi:MAG TPA: CD225/dispanin family protein [Streptosporangiaceae bacterium]|nr:CD225/dispanin family protein [Streptosporangiaceae bacterium]
MSYSPAGPPPGPGKPGQIHGQPGMPGGWSHRGSSPASGQHPADYRIWITIAIVAGALFSVILGAPLGLVALHYSRRVRRSREAGDQHAADAASRAARAWAIASAGGDIAGIIAVFVIITHGGKPAGWM